MAPGVVPLIAVALLLVDCASNTGQGAGSQRQLAYRQHLTDAYRHRRAIHHRHKARHHRHRHHPPPPASSAPATAAPVSAPPASASAAPAAWCTASASYNSQYNDYDVYVHSNRPDRTATATASNGKSWSYRTNGSGYADIYLDADPGNSISVTVGPASCSTSAG